ncbi:nitroreductase [Mycolicibacterium litorale]|uniref:nitroreductase n=1 Tax=Mycolicibacterium litorale TaxID=758802 RepID=UPI003CEF8098
MAEFDHVVQKRRSIRLFHPDKPVPRSHVTEALELARRAPSNSNTQPWHLVLASGAARERLVTALLNESRIREPAIPTLPVDFETFKYELGAQLYGSLGIARDDVEGRRKAIRLNWRFYNAPLAGIVCMPRDLHHVDSLGVGMFLQTFILGLTARGLGTCVQMLIAGFPDVVRQALHIPAHYEILCGLAIGYAVEDFPANNLDVPRKPIDDTALFLDQ